MDEKVKTDNLEGIGEYKYGFHDSDTSVYKSKRGFTREIVEEISRQKNEPDWMLQIRLKAYEHAIKRPMPTWGGDLSGLKLDDMFYYIRPSDKTKGNWDDVPDAIKNTFDKLGIPEAERKFLAGVGAQYECLSGDTRVYTGRGLVMIRDVRAGDIVFALDETMNEMRPAPVKAMMPKGERPVFEVKVGTRIIHATENHPFLTLEYHRQPGRQRGRYARAWKYLRDLKAGDLVAVAKTLPDVGQAVALEQPAIKTEVVGRNQSVEYPLDITNRYNAVTLPQRTSEDLMWWLGLYIGDGFIHHQADADKARVEFAIPATDEPLRTELKRVTSQLFELGAKNGNPDRMSVNSTIIARYLEVNGFSGGALEKRVPDWVGSLPQSQILAFVGGYIDADGYVRDHRSNHDVVLTSGNSALLQDVRNLAAQCGLPTSSIHRFESKHPHDKDRSITGYRLEFAGDFERLGCRSVQRTARLGKRKFHHDHSSAEGTTFRAHVNEHFGYVRIDSIEAAGVQQVYDIEVDGPHNFVAEGLIVHNSEMVYHSIRENLEQQGVIFLSSDDGLKQYPDIFKEHFGTVIPYTDNKFAAINTAVWSGGSFVYVPKGVHVEMPLQAYFRLNSENSGQFERTMIIVDEGAQVHYVEGCFLAGARVRTRSGEKPIEQIAVGDEVLTHQGRYRRVYNTMNRPYHNNIYRIRFLGDSDRELQVTAEHPLLIVRRERENERNRNFETEWVSASTLKVGDYLTIPVPQPEMEMALAGINDAPAGSLSGSPFEMDDRFLYVPVRSITTEEMETTVYNFSVEEDESYVCEGVVSHNCTAPTYSSDSFHSGVIEIIVKRGARCRYTTIQNWSINVYNLVTQRAMVAEDGIMEWTDANLGSKLTMKYPSTYLMGKGARGEILSMAFAGKGQHQDTGGKVVHVAPHTRSKITSKSISKDGGRASYRGLLKVYKGAEGSSSHVQCDALLLDETSRTDTYPYIEVDDDRVTIGHEATVSKIGDEQLFYLMSRGLNEVDARAMVVSGFIEPLVKELPMEYAVEMNRLIHLQMEGSVG